MAGELGRGKRVVEKPKGFYADANKTGYNNPKEQNRG